VVSAIVGLPVLLLGAAVVTFATSDHPLGGEPEKVPCAEALAFGGARLPKEAYGARCTVQTWLDTRYVARFRMPREAVDDWLEAAYPEAPEPRTKSCYPESVDLCLHLDMTAGGAYYAGEVPGASGPGFGANGVDVDVAWEDGDTALVEFTAFTV
jgi:hypothetical protein